MATAVSPRAVFELRCLGPVVLSAATGARLALRTSKQVALVLLLARHPGRAVSRDRLVELLWSEGAERKARHSLSQSLSLINKVLGVDALVAGGANQVRLRESLVWLDVTEFERLAADGRHEEARALWRGTLLDGLWVPRAPNFQHWLGEEREGLERILRRVSRELIEARRTEGDYQGMRAEAESLLELDGLDEGAMLACLESLSLTGERTLALRRYGEFEKRLREELEAEPGSRLRAWARRHRRGDGESPSRIAVLPPRVSETMVLPAAQPLFGRVEEFELLWRAWEQAGTGKGAFVVLEGEAGIGKTALAGKLANQVHVAGGSVCFVKCYRTEKSVPFAPISALIRQLSRLPGFVAASPSWIGEMTRLVPELRERFPSVPQPLPGDDAARYRLCDAAVHAAEAVADENPLLVVVDDIQDADEASLALLHYLGRQASQQPIFLLTTTRTGQERTEFERTFFETARSAGLARFVGLAGLPDGEIRRIAGQVMAQRGLEVHEHVLQRIVVQAAGIPLHAIEASMTGGRSFATRPSGNATATDQEAAFDESAVDRLARAPSPARTAAQTLAVAGRPLSEYELAAVGQLKAADLASAISTLERSRFVSRDGAAVAVAHERYVGAVLATLSARERKALQLRLARLLTKAAAHNPASRIEAAKHYRDSGRLSAARRESLAAARFAVSVGAVRERAAALHLALQSSRDGGLKIAVLLGECLLELRDFSSLKTLCSQSCADSRCPDELRKEFRYLDLAAHLHGGDVPFDRLRNDLVTLVEDPTAFGHEAPARALLVRAADRTGDHLFARQQVRLLRKRDRASQGGRLSAHALEASAFVAAKYYRPERALRWLQESLAVAQEEYDWALEHQCRAGLGAVLRQLGRFRESVSELERGLALARRTLNPQAAANRLIDIACAETALGEYDSARERFREAGDVERGLDSPLFVMYKLCNRGELSLILQEFEAAERDFRAAQEQAAAISIWPTWVMATSGLALCAQRTGDRSSLDHRCTDLRRFVGGKLRAMHDRWMLDSSLAWDVAINHAAHEEADAALRTSCAELKKRDKDHWLRLELERLRLCRAHTGSVAPDQLDHLVAEAQRYEANGVLAEAIGLEA